jgi:diguanylate cyclase (GGDEF)-like protein
MASFRLKLVLWFALLALLPLTIAFYGYDTLTRQSETRRADAALEASLRSAVAGYAERLDLASRSAERLAADVRLQRALRGRDRRALATLVRPVAGAEVTAHGLRVGSTRTPAAVRSVTVVDRGKTLGRISVRVPIDATLLASLGAGLTGGGHLVAVRGGRIVAGRGAGLAVALSPGDSAPVRVGDVDYRGLMTRPVAAPGGLALVALTPQRAIDSATRASERRIAVALIGALVLFALATYLLGRSIVATLRRLAAAARALASGRLDERVEVRGRDEFAQLGAAFNEMAEQLEQRLAELQTERRRVQDATARFGEALVATLDPDELLRVVVSSAVEATSAAGGAIVARDGTVRAGDPGAAGERASFPLRAAASDFGTLELVAPAFSAAQRETAASLAAQAVVALENARLHRLVEQQALVDGLTGLANRRSLDETLRTELARAGRYGGDVCLVLSDLDDFKRVNDRYGHPAGDEVLRTFAQVLGATVRESDVAGRWGGEEFALVLVGADVAGGVRYAERARAAIEAARLETPDGRELRVTASFGVAAFPPAADAEALVAAADAALYQAKRGGKNRVVRASGPPEID